MGIFSPDELQGIDHLTGSSPTPPPSMQPAAPPQQQPAAQQQPAQAQQPAPQTSGFAAGVDQLAASAPQGQAPVSMPKGMTPESAHDESPLGLIDRAQMGWARTPQEQEKLLRTKFDDVKMVPSQSGATFAVKQGNEWYQANPNFEWKWNTADAATGAAVGMYGGGLPGAAVVGGAAGVARSFLDGGNLKKLAGEAAQSFGEYGLRATAAGIAGEEGMVAGAAVGAPAGPIGMMVGGAIGGLAGAAAGASSAESADLASRRLLDPNTPGAIPYKNADEVNKELVASAMFGADSFAMGKLGQIGAGYAADKFAKVIKSFQDTPEGHQAVRKMLGMLGSKPEEIEARLMNPQQNAAFDKMRALDNLDANPIKLGRLDMAQEAATDDLHGAVTSLAQKQGAEYAALAKDPKVRAAEFDLSSHFAAAKQALTDAELVKGNGEINGLRVLGDGDKEAINFIMNRQTMAKGLEYGEARATVVDIRTLLDKGINNANIKRVLVQLKDGGNTSIGQTLEDVSAGSGVKYGEINNKYATAMSVKEALDTATSGNKRFALGQKLTNDNPNATKATMDELVNAGIDPNMINKFVQMQGSRNSDSWFTGQRLKVAGVPIPLPGGKVAATAITAGSALRQAVSPMSQAVLPYMHKTVSALRALPPDQLKSIITNPAAIDAITGTVYGAAQNEQATKQQLLQQSGALGNGGQQQ